MVVVDRKKISDAFYAHYKWKLRLLECIQKKGNCDCTVENIRNDRLCEFGMWLSSLDSSQMHDDFGKKIKVLHKEFHNQAAIVLQYSKDGNSKMVAQCMGEDGAYTLATNALFNELLRWEKNCFDAKDLFHA